MFNFFFVELSQAKMAQIEEKSKEIEVDKNNKNGIKINKKEEAHF